MSERELRRLETEWAANPGDLALRERLLAEGQRRGRNLVWAREIMGGPHTSTFLTWRHPSGPRTVHLVRFARNGPDQRRGLNSPLLCRCDTIAGRPANVCGRPLPIRSRMALWPLNLVWREQGQVTCRVCIGVARPFRVVLGPSGEATVEVAVGDPPRRWSGLLARHQATYWGRWHPLLWPVDPALRT